MSKFWLMLPRRIPAAKRLLALFSVALCILAGGNSVMAEKPPAVSVRWQQVGFDGWYKIGRWSPLAVEVTATQAAADVPTVTVQLVVSTFDPDGNTTILRNPPVAIASGVPHTLHSVFRNGRLTAHPQASVVVRGEGTQEWTIPLPELSNEQPAANSNNSADTPPVVVKPPLKHEAFLAGSLGPLPAILKDTPQQSLTWCELPTVADDHTTSVVELESLDALMLTGGYDLPANRANTILEWVRQGGHLLIAVGEGSAAYQQSVIGKALSGEGGPIPLGENYLLKDFATLERFVNKGKKVDDSRPNNPAGVAILQEDNGNLVSKTLVSMLTGPLIVQVPLGFGKVTFIGTDVATGPVSRWPGLPGLVEKLLVSEQDTPLEEDLKKSAAGQLAYTGVTELTTQFHALQSRFPQVSRPGSWTILGLLLVYLVIVGPLDYLIVHRILRRPQLTWVTLPLMLAGAVLLATTAAGRANGQQLMVNQLDLLDIDAETNLVRGRSWSTIYSPETRRYAVTAQPASWCGQQVDGLTLSWSAAPESAFGGLYRSSAFDLGRPNYSYSNDLHKIENLPIAVWSTAKVTSSWSAREGGLVESNLVESRSNKGKLQGSFTHHLPVPIEDWIIAYDKRVYLPQPDRKTKLPQPIRPGIAWPPNDPAWRVAGGRQRELNGYLTGETSVVEQQDKGKQQYRTQMARYVPLTDGQPDPYWQVARMLTFHEQVGGSKYTGLNQDSLRQLDFSADLKLGRAVLFGRIRTEEPVTGLTLTGHQPETATRETFIRIILPVRRE